MPVLSAIFVPFGTYWINTQSESKLLAGNKFWGVRFTLYLPKPFSILGFAFGHGVECRPAIDGFMAIKKIPPSIRAVGKKIPDQLVRLVAAPFTQQGHIAG